MTAPDYGRAFALWRARAPQWRDYTHHAFVEGLRTGDLPRARFLHYLRQDYVFLIHFARDWALAAAKADTLAELQAASAVVQALAHVEMPLHVQLCAAAGIDAATLEATEEAPENLAYTRYVLEAGYSGDFLDLWRRWRPACWAMVKSARGWRAAAGLTPVGSTPMPARIIRRCAAMSAR